MDDKWRKYARCLEVDTDLFFPEAGGGFRDQTRAAQAVCATCPVRPDCLREAVETQQRYGVWGGVSQRKLSHIITEINTGRTTLDAWLELENVS